MTLVGKIFIVSIMVMSVVFMGFAMAVYSAHTSWRDEIFRPAAGPDGDIGLKFQVEAAQAENEKLRKEIEDYDEKLAAEIATRRADLTKLENERATLLTQRDEARTQLDKLQETSREMSGTVAATQENLGRLVGEVERLRGEIRNEQKTSDERFEKVVKATDELHDKYNELVVLQEREAQLVAQIKRYKVVMAAKNINPEAEVASTPPVVAGQVTSVRQNNLIEVSIGSDDGLRIGHTLEVYRAGRAYLGRAQIIKTAPDRAVAKILPDFRKGVIQKGDSVATRLKLS